MYLWAAMFNSNLMTFRTKLSCSVQVPFEKALCVRLGLKKGELRMAPPEAMQARSLAIHSLSTMSLASTDLCDAPSEPMAPVVSLASSALACTFAAQRRA